MISAAGSQMQNVAINWQIYVLTGSPVALGLVGLVRLVPILVFSMVGGVVADTHDRRRIMFFTQSAMMLVAAALAVATMVGLATPALILVLTAASAAAVAFDAPARQSLLPNLVPREHLTNALSLNTMMFQAATIVGPAAGGFIIHGLGIHVVYWVNAVSFLAVLGGLALMRMSDQPHRGATQMNLTALAEGFRFVRCNGLIFSTMMLDFLATFFSSASALIPIFAKDILNVGADGMGLLYSADSVGSLIAGMGISLRGDLRPKGLILFAAVLVYGIATALYGFSTQFALSLFLLGLVGAGDAISTILRSTIRQMVTPDQIRGRMTAVNMMFFMGGPQLGNLEAGLAAAWLGAPLSVVTGGLGTILMVVLIAWLSPQLRRYDT